MHIRKVENKFGSLYHNESVLINKNNTNAPVLRYPRPK